MAKYVGEFDSVSLYSVNCDTNGNPRYVIHFTDVPFRDQRDDETYLTYQRNHIAHARDILKGKIYRGGDFCGGIVFQSYQNGRDRVKLITDYQLDSLPPVP